VDAPAAHTVFLVGRRDRGDERVQGRRLFAWTGFIERLRQCERLGPPERCNRRADASSSAVLAERAPRVTTAPARVKRFLMR
jgi:hypothetical protein